ncbi:MAG: alpha/beta hydrolase [Burkholderiales bacterium]|nr:alpha/beta hydrolase [Burkholderiales bacterium]
MVRGLWGVLQRLLVLGVVCLLASGCVQNVFYQPDRVVYDAPHHAGLAYERVAFASRDGTRLMNWFIPAATAPDARQAKGTVVHFHGNAQNMSSHWQFVGWLARRGYNVFVFDYRGYGDSAGHAELQGVYADSHSALDYVRSRADVDPTRLLVLGQSLGGTNAIAVVGSGNRAGVRAMAIEATFSSYSAIASEKVPGTGWLMSDAYSAARHVGQLAPIPLLLIHGTADAVVPYHHSQRLLEAAQTPKTLLTVEGGAHLDAFTPRFGTRYQAALLDFFDAALRTPDP